MTGTRYPLAPLWVTWSSRGLRRLPGGRYVLMNWFCRFSSARPFQRPLGVTGGRVRFICDLRDGIAREACFMGYYEPQETVLVRRLLRPGMTFVDAGANWGYYTLLAAHLVGPAGSVVAFEPHPELYRRLEENVTINRFDHIAVVEAAVAGEDGEMDMIGYGEGDLNQGISRLTTGAPPPGAGFRVATCRLGPRLDALGVGEVDLLKLDIEGAESLVVPTMADDLARARYRRILLELHPAALREQGQSPTEIIGQLTRHGYRVWRLDHSPEAFRRAAYRLPASADEFCTPFDPAETVDAWPHFLCTAPGVQDSW